MTSSLKTKTNLFFSLKNCDLLDVSLKFLWQVVVSSSLDCLFFMGVSNENFVLYLNWNVRFEEFRRFWIKSWLESRLNEVEVELCLEEVEKSWKPDVCFVSGPIKSQTVEVLHLSASSTGFRNSQIDLIYA